MASIHTNIIDTNMDPLAGCVCVAWCANEKWRKARSWSATHIVMLNDHPCVIRTDTPAPHGLDINQIIRPLAAFIVFYISKDIVILQHHTLRKGRGNVRIVIAARQFVRFRLQEVWNMGSGQAGRLGRTPGTTRHGNAGFTTRQIIAAADITVGTIGTGRARKGHVTPIVIGIGARGVIEIVGHVGT